MTWNVRAELAPNRSLRYARQQPLGRYVLRTQMCLLHQQRRLVVYPECYLAYPRTNIEGAPINFCHTRITRGVSVPDIATTSALVPRYINARINGEVPHSSNFPTHASSHIDSLPSSVAALPQLPKLSIPLRTVSKPESPSQWHPLHRTSGQLLEMLSTRPRW